LALSIRTSSIYCLGDTPNFSFNIEYK
jgi:hypothetical protein